MGNKLSPSESEANIKAWLVEYLAGLLEMDTDDVDVYAPVASYGLDSSGAAGMVGDLGEYLGRKLDPEMVYRFATIHALAQHLASGQ